jgi:hypothetical protein
MLGLEPRYSVVVVVALRLMLAGAMPLILFALARKHGPVADRRCEQSDPEVEMSPLRRSREARGAGRAIAGSHDRRVLITAARVGRRVAGWSLIPVVTAGAVVLSYGVVGEMMRLERASEMIAEERVLERLRPVLFAIACRMLGSVSAAP